MTKGKELKWGKGVKTKATAPLFFPVRPVEPQAKTIAEIGSWTKECRFPQGEAHGPVAYRLADQKFCALPVVEGTPYCPRCTQFMKGVARG